jgi:CD63 antigen
MGDTLTGGAKCIKYLLFVFNLLFLLCGLALIVVGAIVQVQTKDTFNGSASSAGIFLIVVGSLIFIVCFFGCAGAINNNYCMVVTFGVLLLLILLAEVAAIITGFVLKDKVNDAIMEEMIKNQREYDNDPETIATRTWNQTQIDLECCGTTDYMSWNVSEKMRQTQSVPDSCCKSFSVGCGYGKLSPGHKDVFYEKGCHETLMEFLHKYLIAVGIVAAVVAVIQLIGIIFAFCLANQLRKDYRVV